MWIRESARPWGPLLRKNRPADCLEYRFDVLRLLKISRNRGRERDYTGQGRISIILYQLRLLHTVAVATMQSERKRERRNSCFARGSRVQASDDGPKRQRAKKRHAEAVRPTETRRASWREHAGSGDDDFSAPVFPPPRRETSFVASQPDRQPEETQRAVFMPSWRRTRPRIRVKPLT